MSDDELRIRRLIAAGDYWEALNLDRGAGNDQVILRVLSLQDQHPRLATELSRVQTALTRERAAYERARKQFTAICRQLESAHGPVLLGMELQMTGGAVVLRNQIWQRVSTALAAPGSQKNAGRELARQLAREMGVLTGSLPALDIAWYETTLKEAIRNLGTPRPSCARCRGTGQIHLLGSEVIQEARRNQGLMRNLLAQPKLPELVRQALTSGQELPGGRTARSFDWPDPHDPFAGLAVQIPCPECTTEVTFALPEGVSPGWVLEAKPARGGRVYHARAGTVETEPPAAPAEPATPLDEDLLYKVRAFGDLLLQQFTYSAFSRHGAGYSRQDALKGGAYILGGLLCLVGLLLLASGPVSLQTPASLTQAIGVMMLAIAAMLFMYARTR